MDIRKKVPEIRFDEFEGEWERCDLKNIATFSKGTGYSKSDLVPEGTPIILYGRMYTNYETTISNVDSFVIPKKKSVYSRGGEVIVPASGESAEDISVASVVRNPDVILGGDLNIISPSKDVDPAFLAMVISHGKAHDEMAKMAQGKTVVHLHNNDLEQVEFIHPQYEEQKKISYFIILVEDTIAVQEVRHEKLLALKKAMLQTMFPQARESVPQIRFGEFEGGWGYVELKKIAGKVVERNNHRDYTETFTNSAEYGIISQRDYFDHDISNANNINSYYIVAENDFVYNPRISTHAPVGPINRNKLERKGIMSPLYTVFRPHDVDYSYLEWFFKSKYWHPYMFYNGDNGARYDRFSIKDDVFFDMPIPFPYMEEQQKIGEYFDTLENAIIAQAQKIAKLKQMKSALMQKMFI